MELTRTPLNQGKMVHSVENYEIKTSNDDEIRQHKRHSAASELQFPTWNTSPDEVPSPKPPPPPEPNSGFGGTPGTGLAAR